MAGAYDSPRTATMTSMNPNEAATQYHDDKKSSVTRNSPQQPSPPQGVTISSDSSAEEDTAAVANSKVPGGARPRLNSRDIPRCYSGLYGEDDMLPFEVNRMSSWWVDQQWNLLVGYVIVIFLVEVVVLLVVSAEEVYQGLVTGLSWTWTNGLHFLVSLVYLHWLKGGTLDHQGEMIGLTLWEQMEATKGTENLRFGLRLIPVLLTWAACLCAKWDWILVAINVVILFFTMLGKLPFMDGVRIFGINRTPGIDDDKVAAKKTE